MTTLDEISALTRPNHPDDWTELDSQAVDTVRVLAAEYETPRADRMRKRQVRSHSGLRKR